VCERGVGDQVGGIGMRGIGKNSIKLAKTRAR